MDLFQDIYLKRLSKFIKKNQISIIILAKNSYPGIKKAIRSIEIQEYPSLEIIIQCNPTCKKTVNYIKTLASKKFIIKKIFSKDKNVGDAWNKSLKHVSGDIVGSLDTDNMLQKNILYKINRHFVKNKNDQIIYGNVVLKSKNKTFKFIPDDYNAEKLKRIELVPPFSATFFNLKKLKKENLKCTNLNLADFSIWLKNQKKIIKKVNYTVCTNSWTKLSSTFNYKTYNKYVKARLDILNYYEKKSSKLQIYRSNCYFWAASSLNSFHDELVASNKERSDINRLIKKFINKSLQYYSKNKKTIELKRKINL